MKKRKLQAVPGWDDAILVGEEQIEQWRRRICVVEGAIQVFKSRRDEGMPFPGTEGKSSREPLSPARTVKP